MLSNGLIMFFCQLTERVGRLGIFLSLVAIFLFPGCRIAKKAAVVPSEEVPEPVIRVKLAGPADKVLVAIDGDFEIYDSRSQVLGYGRRLAAGNCYVAGDKLMFGVRGVCFGRGDYCDVVPKENGVLSVNNRYYRGSLRIYRVGEKVLLVNHVRIEDYLKGVLPGELPKRFEQETFKAQAICARTFALYEKYTLRGARRWDVTATEASQVYFGKSVEISKANRAVELTRGIVLTAMYSDGKWKIFPTYYSSTCGGWTQSAKSISNISYDIKPLRGGVKCDTCKISPYYRWSDRRISAVEVADALKKRGLVSSDASSIVDIEVLKRTAFGRIASLSIRSDNGEQLTIGGERFRLVIGSRRMPSTWCDIKRVGDEYVFTHGRGLGHGVGMCQYGAEGMAREGYTALEILAHYYPSSKPVRVY